MTTPIDPLVITPHPRIGNFSFRVERNHDGSEYYVSMKRGWFGKRTWARRYWDGSICTQDFEDRCRSFLTYVPPMSMEQVVNQCLNHLRQRAQSVVNRERANKLAKRRTLVHKEP